MKPLHSILICLLIGLIAVEISYGQSLFGLITPRHSPHHTPEDIGPITVYPKGKSLPVSFLKQPWRSRGQDMMVLNCDRPCDALVKDLDGDGQDDILLTRVRDDIPTNIQLFRQQPNRHWLLDAQILAQMTRADLDAIHKGAIAFPRTGFGVGRISIGGRQYRLDWMIEDPNR